MPSRTTSATALADGATKLRTAALSPLAFRFLVIVVVVQGGHVIEHVVQALQVFVFAVPEDDALGLLGYVLQFDGTEEWLHLGFNKPLPPARSTPSSCHYGGSRPPCPHLWRSAVFMAASVWLETWHMVEHGVIISNVIANGGCPCPGHRRRRARRQRHVLHLSTTHRLRWDGVRSRVCAARSRLYAALARPPGSSAVREARGDATKRDRVRLPG